MPATQRAEAVNGLVAENDHGPGEGLALGGIVGRRLVPEVKEPVLESVTGLLFIIQNAPGERKETARKAVIQFRERSLVPRGYALQDRFVGLGLHVVLIKSGARHASFTHACP